MFALRSRVRSRQVCVRLQRVRREYYFLLAGKKNGSVNRTYSGHDLCLAECLEIVPHGPVYSLKFHFWQAFK